jgi:hypothetical protein
MVFKVHKPTLNIYLAIAAALFLFCTVTWQKTRESRMERYCSVQVLYFYARFGVNDPKGSWKDRSAYWTNARVCLVSKCMAYKGIQGYAKGMCEVNVELAPMYNSFRPGQEH